MRRKYKTYFKRWAIVSVTICLLALFIAVTVTQRLRLASLRAQQTELQQKLNELQMEELRLKLYAKYVYSNEFADDYVHNQLGYISPTEIILTD